MGGNLCTGRPVLVNWDEMPEVELVTDRFRTKKLHEIATKYSRYRYEVKMQPEVVKGAVYILRVYCYVYSGRQVLLEFKKSNL